MSKKPSILAFDISASSTGVAFLKNNRIVSKSLSTIKTTSKQDMGERLIILETRIKELITEYNPDLIVVEDIFRGPNITTFKTLAMFRGVAFKAIYEVSNKDPISIMAVEARNFARVSKTKELAFEEINQKYSLNFTFEEHNDIVDAIILALAVSNGATTTKKVKKKKGKKKK